MKYISISILCLVFITANCFSQNNNDAPKSSLSIGSTLFDFNTYLKNKNYKKFINASNLRSNIGYLHRIGQGSWYQCYIGASVGINTFEYNQLQPGTMTETYNRLRFISSMLAVRAESAIKNSKTFFLSLGYSYAINPSFRKYSESGTTLLKADVNNFGNLKALMGLRFLITKKFSIDLGLGGDLPLGNKVELEGKKYSIFSSFFSTNLYYRLK